MDEKKQNKTASQLNKDSLTSGISLNNIKKHYNKS